MTKKVESIFEAIIKHINEEFSTAKALICEAVHEILRLYLLNDEYFQFMLNIIINLQGN